MNKRVTVIVLAAVIVSSRLVNLSADPPEVVGLHFVSDEGWWVHNARNYALFGAFVLDDFNQSLFIAPTFCLTTAAIYRILGVSLFTSRLASALSGILIALLVPFLLLRWRRSREALVFALLFSLDHPFTSLNRIAFVDTMMLCFMTLAALAAIRAGRRPGWGFPAGVAFGLAFCTKSYALPLAPAIICFLLVETVISGTERALLRNTASAILLFVTGTVTVLSAWAVFILWPNWEDFKLMYYLWRDGNVPHGLAHALKNIGAAVSLAGGETITWRAFWISSLPLVVLAWGWGGMFLFQTDVSWRQRLQRLTAIDRMAIIWLLWAGAAFLPLTAKPLRRYIVLLPQLAWLATLCVVQLRQFRWPAGRRGPVTTILAACYLAALPAIYLTPPLAGLAQSSLSGVLSRVKAGQQPGLHGEVIALLMLAAVACSAVVVFVVLRRRIIWNGWRISLPFAAVAVAIATWNLGQTALTLVRPTFTLRDTSRALRDKFYDGVTVFGGVADSLALETNAFAFAYWGRQETGRILNQDPIERFQPHYITIVRQLGVPWIREQRYEEVLPGATVAETLSFLPDRKGNPRVIIDLYRAAQPLPPRAADATVTTRRSRPDRLVHRSPP